MQELTLKELQKACLEILIDFHAFCVKNNIKYSIDYGTLIGALRHKGFIPWDDDVDVVIPRPDFERFCKTYSSDDYKLIFYGNDPSALAAFARVVDCRKTHYESAARPWTKQESGVWIDVFPIDGVEESEAQYARRYSRLRKICDTVHKFRWQNHHIRKGEPLRVKFKALAANFVGFGGRLPAAFVRRMVAIMKSVPYGSTRFVGQCSYLDDGPIQFPIEDFKDFVLIPFENHEFYAISGYDHHLRQLYGDYMQLPPEYERVPKQFSVKFYKKEY